MTTTLVVIAVALVAFWIIGRVMKIVGFALHLLLLAAAVLLVIGLISR